MLTPLLDTILESVLTKALQPSTNLQILDITSLAIAEDSADFNEKVREQKYATLVKALLLGLHPYRVTFICDNKKQTLSLMLKGYSNQGVDAKLLPDVLDKCDIKLSKPISSYFWGKEFGPSANREINFYALQKNFHFCHNIPHIIMATTSMKQQIM